MKFAAALSLLVSSASIADAFVVQGPFTMGSNGPLEAFVSNSRTQQSTAIFMSDDREEIDVPPPASEYTEEAAPEEAPEIQEDPEVTAIKEEIAQLESTLKEKRRELAYVSDKADEYTKSGYARKVAEMENMRRARSVSAQELWGYVRSAG